MLVEPVGDFGDAHRFKWFVSRGDTAPAKPLVELAGGIILSEGPDDDRIVPAAREALADGAKHFPAEAEAGVFWLNVEFVDFRPVGQRADTACAIGDVATDSFAIVQHYNGNAAAHGFAPPIRPAAGDHPLQFRPRQDSAIGEPPSRIVHHGKIVPVRGPRRANGDGLRGHDHDRDRRGRYSQAQSHAGLMCGARIAVTRPVASRQQGRHIPPVSEKQSPDVISFGCRLNALEGENVRVLADAAGVDDAVVINTCAVTAQAVRQARQTIRKVRRERPGVTIIATGCAAQTEPETFAGMAEVDHVVGNTDKLSPGLWAGLTSADRIVVNDIMSVQETAPHLANAFATRTRAFVEVQNGCDHRCTFCIIPYGRGNSRSVPMGAVIEKVKALVGSGHQEVVLTGVDLTSYGPDLPGKPTLGDLVQRILRFVPDLPRLRLSSIDSIEADDALMDAIGGDARLMPHLHLSLQAGDDMILKRMKRRHLRDDAIRFCAEVRARRPEVVFGADLIAGFPTETDAMFENTLKLLDECDLTHVHAFPFSPRQGTPAARMPQLPKAVVKARAKALREAAAGRYGAALANTVGSRATVLVEQAEGGRTNGYLPARVPGANDNTIVSGQVTGVADGVLVVDMAA